MSSKPMYGDLYSVVLDNGSGMLKYSVIRDGDPIPKGWQSAGKKGTKQACLDYIEEVWTDMRPADLANLLKKF